MSRIPESYPFLRIAKQYGVPYADVLQHAHRYRTYEGDFVFLEYSDIDNEIASATVLQTMIRDGEINWLTGETIA